jgi:hypothetical protein
VGRLIDKYVPLRVRAAALMPAAVLTVHQLRFQLAFGDRADSSLAAEGHQYLTALAPLAAMLVAIGSGLFIAALARARRGVGEEHRAPGLLLLWLAVAATLLAIYSAQELAEGALVSGHPAGVAGVFGHGGLWVLPLALLLGGVVALALRIGSAAIAWVAGRAATASALPVRPRPAARPAPLLLASPEPLAALAAGRAPPRPLA